jgi:hypothetical protein
MYRKGTLFGSRKAGRHGEFRAGTPGDARVSVHMNNGDDFQNPVVIMEPSFDDRTQFANPMYDTLQNTADSSVAQIDANANTAEPLPEKSEIEV